MNLEREESNEKIKTHLLGLTTEVTYPESRQHTPPVNMPMIRANLTPIFFSWKSTEEKERKWNVEKTTIKEEKKRRSYVECTQRHPSNTNNSNTGLKKN